MLQTFAPSVSRNAESMKAILASWAVTLGVVLAASVPADAAAKHHRVHPAQTPATMQVAAGGGLRNCPAWGPSNLKVWNLANVSGQPYSIMISECR